jgi:O-antigen/teichoic acid export membrane protein
MFIAFYTTRVVLNSLGITDYGIYNVVGGFVTMFTFLTGPLKTATQRFLNFEMGKSNNTGVRRVFNTSLFLYIITSIILIIILETIGYYIFTETLNIPENRMTAAKWVFHFTVFSSFFILIAIPFEAMLNAHEKMNIIAGLELFGSISRLVVAYVIVYVACDNLIIYSFLLAIIPVIIFLFLLFYCKRKYPEVKYLKVNDRKLIKEIGFFTGWNLFGAVGGSLQQYGTNVLLNIFFGTAINAAYGVSRQVSNALAGFSSNFIRAVSPQITQSYSSGETDYCYKLIFSSSKYSFFLLLTLILPCMIEMPRILDIWLKEIPPHTILFCRLILIEALINSLSQPLMIAAQATGKIKLYQSVVGGLIILNFPLSYIALTMGANEYSVLIIAIIISIACFVARLLILKKIMDFPVKSFFNFVIQKALLVLIIAPIIPLLFYHFTTQFPFKILFTFIISVLSCVIIIYFLGINKSEKRYLTELIKKVLCKR